MVLAYTHLVRRYLQYAQSVPSLHVISTLVAAIAQGHTSVWHVLMAMRDLRASPLSILNTYPVFLSFALIFST